MRKGVVPTPIWIVFSLLTLYGVILISFHVVVPLIIRFYDPCWGKVETGINKIIPTSFEFRDEYTVNISFTECVSRISVTQERADHCTEEGKWYFLAYPNPVDRGTMERIADAVKQNMFFSEGNMRQRNIICIATDINFTLAQDKTWDIMTPGEYTFQLTRRSKNDYSIDYTYYEGVFAEAYRETQRRAARYGLGENFTFINENMNFKNCLRLLDTQSRNYLLFNRGVRWDRLEEDWGNIFLITQYDVGEGGYVVAAEEFNDQEFVQLDCHSDWTPITDDLDWIAPVGATSITLNSVLSENACDTDSMATYGIAFDDLRHWNNVNDDCLELMTRN